MRLLTDQARRTLRGDRVVLDDVTFTIEPGEPVAIAGGSKTSLLEVLAGLQTLDAGSVSADGADVDRHGAWFREQPAHVRRTTSSTRGCRCGVPSCTPPGCVSSRHDEH